jgi:H+/Cl- antiporter ClcA
MWELAPAGWFFFIFLPVIFLLLPVWLGLYWTWREKDRKNLKKLLKIWTRNWFVVCTPFIALGVLAIVLSLPPYAPSPIKTAIVVASLAYGVYWVMGAIGTLFIWAIRKE